MFDEVQFPKDIVAFGSQSGPGHQTMIVETDSGHEERVGRWPYPRHRFRVNLLDRSNDEIAILRTFAIARQGALRGFRVKDHNDFTSNTNGTGSFTSTDVQIGIGNGAKKIFQLKKLYTSGLSTVERKIIKPVAGQLIVAVNAVTQSLGADYTIDNTTGAITFTTAPAVTLPVTAGYQFDVPVRLSEEVDAWLGTSRDDVDENTVTALSMVELLDPSPLGAIRPYGGSIEKVISGNIVMSLLEAHTYVIDAQIAGLKVAVPPPAGLPTGGELWSVIREGANDFTVVDDLGATLATLTSGTAVDIHLSDDDAGGFIWYAF